MESKTEQKGLGLFIKYGLIYGLIGMFTLIGFLLIQNSLFDVTTANRIEALWQIFVKAFTTVVFLVLLYAIFLSRLIRKVNIPRIAFSQFFVFIVVFTIICSCFSSLFQTIYYTQLNPQKLEAAKTKERATLQRMETPEKTIEILLEKNYSGSKIFTNTFSYFLILGLFVAIIVSSFYYKRQFRVLSE